MDGPKAEELLIELNELENLSAGYYMIRVSSNSEILSHEKILKSNPY
jgi:hypothetical protein